MPPKWHCPAKPQKTLFFCNFLSPFLKQIRQFCPIMVKCEMKMTSAYAELRQDEQKTSIIYKRG